MDVDVVTIDYGMGNLLSVKRGLEAAGAKVGITSKGSEIVSARRLILPGVGAFGDGMKELRQRGLIQPINQYVNQGRPLLGICLGMQMLFEKSLEFGEHVGLGYIPGVVQRIPGNEDGRMVRKIPHIGWNSLDSPKKKTIWNDTILQGVGLEQTFYFVHSYMAVPASIVNIQAVCEYDGLTIPAVVEKGSVVGCQFHPEKSGPDGLAILARFLRL